METFYYRPALNPIESIITAHHFQRLTNTQINEQQSSIVDAPSSQSSTGEQVDTTSNEPLVAYVPH
jgi:hypothetical protein